MELSFYQRVQTAEVTDPFMLLGNTRGIYLEGYGAVFTAEVNLVSSNIRNPFMPAPTKFDITRLRIKKSDRLNVLKKHMREALIGAGASLDAVPPEEQIVVGVTLFYFNWEDRTGLPSQVVMSAPRKALLEANRGNGAPLTAALRLQEF
jgi:hypothetical protein